MGDWQWARWAELVFIQNAILLTLVIVIPGQLVTQLVATGRMLSFLEMGFAPMYTVVLPSLGVEALGLAHLAYGLRDVMVSFSSETMDSKTTIEKTTSYYVKLLVSTCVVLFGLVCLVHGTSLSGSISTILTVLSWSFAGIYMCGALPSPVCA